MKWITVIVFNFLLITSNGFAQPALMRKINQTQLNKMYQVKTSLQSKIYRANPELPDSAITFYWDSIVWDTNEIILYKYDGKGNVVEEITRYFNNGVFYNGQRIVKQYNVQNQLTLNTTFFWDSIVWKPSSRERYSYNKGFQQASYYEYFNDTDWVFMYGDSNAFTFNSNNLPVSVISFYYDDFEGKWVRSERYDLTYGTDNKPVQLVGMEWTGSNWRNSMRLINLKWDLGFNYDESEPTAYTIQYFQLGKWLNSEKYSAIVNDSLITIDSNYTFDETLKVWVESFYSTYTYNTKKQLLEKFKWQWDGLMWDTSEVNVYEYDANGNEKYSMMGSKYIGGWFEIWSAQKTFYVYGPNAQIREFWNEYYDSWTGEWQKGVKTKYYYASMASIVGNNKVNLSIFPNPVSECLTVMLEDGSYQLQVLDFRGGIIASDEFSGNQYSLNTGLFDRGIYFLKIIDCRGNNSVVKFYKN